MSFKQIAKDKLTSFKGMVIPAGKSAFNKIRDKLRNFDSDKIAERILYFYSYQFLIDTTRKAVHNIIEAKNKIDRYTRDESLAPRTTKKTNTR